MAAYYGEMFTLDNRPYPVVWTDTGQLYIDMGADPAGRQENADDLLGYAYLVRSQSDVGLVYVYRAGRPGIWYYALPQVPAVTAI